MIPLFVLLCHINNFEYNRMKLNWEMRYNVKVIKMVALAVFPSRFQTIRIRNVLFII